MHMLYLKKRIKIIRNIYKIEGKIQYLQNFENLSH